MNKLLTWICVLMCLSYGVAAESFSMPMIIYGETSFNGYTYAYQDIKITHVDSGSEWNFKSDENGKYMIDLSNLRGVNNIQLLPSMQIKVTACLEAFNPGCSKVITVSTDPTLLNFILTDTDNLISPNAIEIGKLQQQIADQQKLIDAQACPAIVPCPDCPGCQICQTDEEKDAFIGELIVGLLGLIGIIITALLSRYSWGKSFGGLLNYYVNQAKIAADKKDYINAKKNIDRVIKSINTALAKDTAGTYTK